MNIYYIVLAVVLIGGAYYKYDSDRRKRKNANAAGEGNQGGIEDAPISAIPDLPEGRWCYIDDIVPSLTSNQGGDSNAAQDLVASVALGIAKTGTKPLFIGASAVSSKGEMVSKAAAVQIMQNLALNVPVYEGGDTYGPKRSELGEAIVRESKEGKLNIILGGPAGDLEWAFLNGANVANITLHALLIDTWNETGSSGMASYLTDAMKKSARYVVGRLGGRVFQVKSPDYYHLLFKKNLPESFKDTRAFIDRNRDLKGWNVANSAHILQRNTSLNNNSRNTDTGALRIADVLAMASYCGIKWNQGAAIMNGIQDGLDIMKDRIAKGAANTVQYTDAPVIQEAPVSPVDRSTFNEATCQVYVHPETGGSANALKFTQTAKISYGQILESSYDIRHSKDRVWKGKEYQAGRYIDGTDGIITFDRSKNQWLIYMFEYSLTGENKRPKGWKHAPWVRKGDPVGLISSTNSRNGQWNVSGQRQERSNIHWTTAQ